MKKIIALVILCLLLYAVSATAFAATINFKALSIGKEKNI